MRLFLALLLGLLLPLTAFAAGPAGVRKTVELSMLVTGWAMIERDGSVSKVDLDEREKLPPGVVGLIDTAGTQWKFEPVLVDGVARRAKARMSVRVVAKKLDADQYELKLRSGYFGQEAMTPEERMARDDSIKPLSMPAPPYPMNALKANAQGTVYLLVRVGHDGQVQDVFAEQINLRVIGSANEMKNLRAMFAKSAMAAAKAWRFQWPTTGEYAAVENMTVRVPVDYLFYGQKVPQYGEWDAYVPGPTQTAPWQMEGLDSGQSPDSLIAGVLYEVGKGLRLLTSLQPG